MASRYGSAARKGGAGAGGSSKCGPTGKKAGRCAPPWRKIFPRRHESFFRPGSPFLDALSLKSGKGGEQWTNKDLGVTGHVYTYAAAGALLTGGLTGIALGGLSNIVSAGVVGAISGACLGLFF